MIPSARRLRAAIGVVGIVCLAFSLYTLRFSFTKESVKISDSLPSHTFVHSEPTTIAAASPDASKPSDHNSHLEASNPTETSVEPSQETSSPAASKDGDDSDHGDHKGDNHNADEHKADEHKADEHKADEHKADEHKADEHKADEHKADEHKEGDKSESKPEEKPEEKQQSEPEATPEATPEHVSDEHKEGESSDVKPAGEEESAEQREERLKKEHEEQLQKEHDERVQKEEDRLRDIVNARRSEENMLARQPSPAVPKKLMDPKKILILTMTDYHDTTNPRWNMTLEMLDNRERYARKYGFQHQFLNFTRWGPAKDHVEHAVWLKIPGLQEMFWRHPEVEWIWCLDADALIVNGDLDIRSHILEPSVLKTRLAGGRPLTEVSTRYYDGDIFPMNDNVDVNEVLFIMAHDLLSLNAGSFFVRRSPVTDLVLQFWGDPRGIRNIKNERMYERREQDAFIKLYYNHPMVRDHTAVVAQALMNSFPPEFEHDQGFIEGDLVVHFAGRSGSDSYVEQWPYFMNLTRQWW